MRPFDARIVLDTTPTATGTKDFTAAGVGGAPSGAIIYCARTDGTDDFEAGASLSFGVTDGSLEATQSTWSKDNVSTSVSKQHGANVACIRLFDPDDNSLIVEAVFDSFITDGLRLDFTTVDGTAWRVVVHLFFGTDVDCAVYSLPRGSTGQDVSDLSLGFEPTFIIGSSVDGFRELTTDDLMWRTHAGIDTGSAVQCEGSLMGADNVGTTKIFNVNSTDRLGETTDMAATPIFGLYTFITGLVANGVEAEAQTFTPPPTLPPSPAFFGLAVRASDRAVYLGVNQQTPALAGDVSHGAFKPGYVALWLMGNTNVGRQGFGFLSFGVSDFQNEGVIHLTDKQAATTTVTSTRFDARAVQLYNANASPGKQFEGNVDTRSPSDFDISFDIASGTQRRYHVLAIEEYPFEAAGAAVLGAITAAGTGDFTTIRADAAPALAAVEAAGVGELRFTSTAAPSMAAVTAAGTADLQIEAAATPSLEPIEAVGAGALVFEAAAAQSLATITAVGAADLQIEATAAPALAAVVAAGVAGLEIAAAGTPPLAAVTAAGVASLRFVASATPALTAVTAAGTADLRIEAAAAPAMGPITAVGAASLRFTAVATPALAAIAAAGVATLQLEAVAAPSLGAVTAAGVAALVFEAAGAVSLGAVTAIGAAALTFQITSAAVVLQPVTALGAGTHTAGGAVVLAECVLLAGGRQQVHILAGGRALSAVLAGSRDAVADLAGGSAILAPLAGGRDQVAMLAGGRRPCDE